MEKVPVDEDIQFPFLTTEEPCKSTGLLRVEGKFVSPVQVSCHVSNTMSKIFVAIFNTVELISSGETQGMVLGQDML